MNEGIGYILLDPLTKDIKSKVKLVDEKVIRKALKNIELFSWVAERATYDDEDVELFILKDENYSRAYDFTSEGEVV
jgi:hypothetical protein